MRKVFKRGVVGALAILLLLPIASNLSIENKAYAATVSGFMKPAYQTIPYVLDDNGTLTISSNTNTNLINSDFSDGLKPQVRKIVIQEHITGVFNNDFDQYDNLQEVVLPNCLTKIGSFAFSDCDALESIRIPSSVSVIDIRAFEGCYSLSAIEVDDANNYFQSIDGVLYDKSATRLLSCPGAKTSVLVPTSVRTLDVSAFYKCHNLAEVTIPEGVTEIPNFCFCACENLKEIMLPSTITTISLGAVNGCSSLEKVYYNGSKAEWKAINSGKDNDAFNRATIVCNDGNIPPNVTGLPEIVDGSSATSMYRMFNPSSGEHFYTGSLEEKNQLVASGVWNYEGIAWIAPTSSNTPVYRLYNPASGAHHYTPSADERDQLVNNQGWNYEGIGWYSNDSQTTPMYRLYDPTGTGFAEVRAHHYTASTEERDQLLASGWIYEGIGWYGL